MKIKLLSLCLFLCFLAAVYVGAAYWRRAARPHIYDETAEGAKQIAAALADAQAEHKRVLLLFGANWCGWCHKLHGIFSNDPAIAEKLKRDYVVVEIDVNEEHNKDVDARYGNPTRLGLPVIVILDNKGIALTTKDSSELEHGRTYDITRVLAFLQEWSVQSRMTN